MALLPSALRESVRISPRATTEDFGGGAGFEALGAGLQQGIGAVAELADTIYDRSARTKAQAAATRAGLELQKAAQDLERDPDFETHESRYGDAKEKILAKYREQLQGARYADDFEADYQSLAARLELSVRGNARLTAARTAASNVDLSLANLEQAIANAGGEDEIATYSDRWSALTADALREGIYDAPMAVDAEIRRRRVVEETTLLSRAQLLSGEVWDDGASLSDMTARVRELASGKLEETTLNLVKDRWQEKQIEVSNARAAAAEARVQANDALASLLLGGELTMDAIRERAPLLGAAGVARWVKAATAKPVDGPEQRAYQAERGAMTDAQLAQEEIDPVLAGSQLAALQKRQRAARNGQDTGAAFRSRVAARFNQVREGFDNSWWPMHTNEPEKFKDGVAQDALGQDFWWRALAKWEQWTLDQGKPNATQQEQLLDEVTREWIEQHKSGTEALSPFGPLDRPARDTLQDVPADERKAAERGLRLQGVPATPARIRQYLPYLRIERARADADEMTK